MTKIIGLTGGIGSGKTTVAKAFQDLGVPIYVADDHAKVILNSSPVLLKVKQTFGDVFFNNDNTLKKEELSKLVFEDATKLSLLNAIVHPLVKEHFKVWLLNNKQAKFVIKEAAILFESGSYKDCDIIISVSAPLETRIKRVIARDNSSAESVLQRVNMQWSDEMRNAKSDYLIFNTDLSSTLEQVKNVFKLLND